MATIELVQPKTTAIKTKKRVAAYARVSADTERLFHSVSAQISYYSEYIQKNKDWIYAGVYADYAVTGTQTAHREKFKQMLAEAEAGRIDIILTKSISRFARNTVDLLQTVRHLKDIGVEVRFEEQNISTFSGDGELMLTILGSFAQAESFSISENVSWGLKKRFLNGTLRAKAKHLLGYLYDEKLMQYVIIPDEAEIIREMFAKYVDGVTLRNIADWMNTTGLTGLAGAAFSEGTVRQLLHNEVYAGDICYQKAYVTDPISKKKVTNKGELPKYYQEDAHEAIIDRDTWALVLKEHERRNAMMPPLNCFTGKIKCGKCGHAYTRKCGKVRGQTYVHWICRAKKETGMTCDNRNFSEEELKRLCAWALGAEDFDEETFSREVIGITILDGGDVEFRLTGGRTKVWKNLHVDDTRPKFTVTDCFQNKIFCAKCGRPYHRVVSGMRWSNWCYITKRYGYKGESCDAVNYTDYALRCVSAFMLGLDEFDEQIFTEKVDRITVETDGSLTYRFTDGKEETWQRI